MWRVFGITVIIAMSCYFLQGYDRNIKTLSRTVSIHFRYRWMDRRCRIMDRVLFNVAIFLMVGTFIIAIITW